MAKGMWSDISYKGVIWCDSTWMGTNKGYKGFQQSDFLKYIPLQVKFYPNYVA